MASEAQTPDTENNAVEQVAHHGDTTIIFGREFKIPLYTSVFIALGVLTLIEVVISGFEGDAVIVPLLVLAVAKALLVVIFYMHLKTDNRIFTTVLAVAVGVAILSVLFLLAIPTNTSY